MMLGRRNLWGWLVVAGILLPLLGCGELAFDGATTAKTLEGVDPVPDPDVAHTQPEGDLIGAASWRTLLASKGYTGYLVASFTAGDPPSLATLQKRFPDVTVTRALGALSAADFLVARQRAAQRGATLHNWNAVFAFHVPDPTLAEATLARLFADTTVAWAHPVPTTTLTGIQVPSISPGPGQDYLTNAEGSLNIVAGWDKGLTGAGTTIIDYEHGWNYNHADLNLDLENTPIGLPGVEGHEHGTAVVGILAAQDNGFGVTGMAPDTTIRTLVPGPGYASLLVGIDFFFKQLVQFENYPLGGQILMVEFMVKGANPGFCYLEDDDGNFLGYNGCLPIEAYSATHQAIQDLVALGIVVVEGAGNGGGVNLDENPAWDCGGPCPDLDTDDSGAILVGGSTGPAMLAANFTNCGSRVDVFAWGDQVVTTGYGDHPMSVPGDPNQSYTAGFKGTSSATALIGGMTALIQEHTANIYADQIQPWEYVYLNSTQMRTLLKAAGSPQKDTSWCKIGVQPNLGTALDLLESGFVTPTVAQKPSGICANGGPGTLACVEWCLEQAESTLGFQLTKDCPAKIVKHTPRYDLNGDGRAELIAWGFGDQTWHIDFSAGAVEGYAGWDLHLTPDTPPGPGRLFPVIEDYDGDGRADLAIYNSDLGSWFIRYTDITLLSGDFGDWDTVIYYGVHPDWQPGSRPFPGEWEEETWTIMGPNAEGQYHLAHSIDISLVTPDGKWLFDLHHGKDDIPNHFDFVHPFLQPWQHAMAPAWAFLPIGYHASSHYNMAYKTPDGVSGENVLYDAYGEEVQDYDPNDPDLENYWYIYPAGMFGGNEYQFVPGGYEFPKNEDMGLRIGDTWTIFDMYAEEFDSVPFDDGFGSHLCKPAPADYDGDGVADRAVLCPNGEWRIAYSGPAFPTAADGLRYLYHDGPSVALPGKIYSGGINYQELLGIYEHYNFDCVGQSCSIDDLPPPTGPLFLDCLRAWSLHPLACLSY
jgi:hypothetical protein